MFSYTELIGSTMAVQLGCMPKESTLTPEGLRASAKILEDKAAELDKPKFTKRQVEALIYADEHSLDLIHIQDHSARTYKIVDEYKTTGTGVLTYLQPYNKEAKQFFFPAVLHKGLALKVFRDEYDDIETAVVWPV